MVTSFKVQCSIQVFTLLSAVTSKQQSSNNFVSFIQTVVII